MIFYSEDNVVELLDIVTKGLCIKSKEDLKIFIRERAKEDGYAIILSDKPHGYGEPKYCFSSERDVWDNYYEIRCPYSNICTEHLATKVARGTRPTNCPWGYYNYIAEREKQLREELIKNKTKED